MKQILCFTVLFSFPFLAFALPEELPKDLNPEVKKSIQTSGQDLLAVEDCPFLLQVYDPRDMNVTQLGLCFYTEEKTVGIYKQIACVGALVEPLSGVKSPFYGKKGHWGTEKECTKDRLISKITEKETDTTLNPITDLRMKVGEGRRIRLLRDQFGIWPAVKKQIFKKTK